MKQIDYLRKSRKNCSALLMACALTFMLLTTTLSFAQTNSLTLGCPTRNGNNYQYAALSLTAGDGVVRSISISFSENPDGCSISLPSTSWTVSGNEYSRYIIPAEGATSAQIQAFLQGVTFNVPNGTLKGVNIILSIDDASRQIFYFAGNGHYYEYVPYDGTKTWTIAYNEAKGKEYCGRPGYLATLTTADEDAFVTRIVQNAMWIGGTRLSPTDNATSTGTQYYADFDTEDQSSPETTDYWYWACGPEKGARITNEGAITNSDDDLDWYTAQPRQPNGYTNWMYQVEHGLLGSTSFSTEPNDNDASHGGESCLTILNLEKDAQIWGLGNERFSEADLEIDDYVFGWNDVTYGGNNTSSEWRPRGYLVEYGDQSIGHSQTDEACSISASGLVGNATRTVKATLSGSTAVCAGEEATLNIIFEGGAFPFTGSVQGNNGEDVHFNTNDISYNFTVAPTATTSYTISTFSDASSTTGSNGCQGVYSIVYVPSGSATVTVNTPQVALNDIESVAICAGASTTLTATTETATGEVSYAWSTGATGSEITVTPTSTTTYTVTATATQGGCTATATKSVTVTVNTPQVALKDIASVAICAGASTTLTAELDGTPTGNVAYAWSIGATENEITVTPSETTTYTVTATATQGGCAATATKEVTVTVNELPTATVSVTDVKCNGAGDGIITVNANGGSGSYQYQLGTGTFQASNIFAELAAGDYTLTVKDGNSCTTTATTIVAEPAQLTLTEVTATDETCKENNDGTISYTVGGGTLDYTITFAEGISATKSAAGTYTQSNLLAGDYVVKVVDQNGCSVTAPAVTIKEPATLEIHQEGNIIPAQCKGDSNGQFAFSIAGGNGTNTITINGGAVTLATPSEGVYTQTGLAAGTYTVSVTDNKDCSATKDFVVGEPGAVLSATVTFTQESCTGNDGTATVAATGGNWGYSFEWSNGQNSATATDLSSLTNGGVYTVTVTDAEGCTNVQSVTITLDNPLAMDPITGPAVCTGTEFSITPQNGTNGTIPAGTTYSWPAPDAISGIGGLAAGIDRSSINGVLTNSNSTPQTVSYTVTPKVGVCVGNAADVTVTVTTTVNPNVTIDIPNTMTVCSNAEIFNLSATFVNSVSNSTVVWKKDETTMATHTVTGDTDSYAIDLANDTCKGQYTYRVEYTDVSGCTASDECVITVNAGDWSISQPAGDTTVECVSAAIQPAESLLPVVEDGCGRTTTRTFLRRESSPTPITCAGTVTYTYRYTACDGTYNDWTYTYTINDVTNPTIAADAITTKAANIDQTACKFSIPDLTADIRAKASDNCTAPVDLVISQSLAMGTVITAATDVVVTVTDKCGNSTTHTVNVTVPTLPTATIAPTHILCHGNTTGSATVTPTNGTAPYTYLWSNSQTVATATELDNIEYTVTVTDANGCTTTASVTITEPEALSATTDTVPVDCHGNSTGSATITVTGGIPSYSVTVNGVTKSGNSALTFENLPDGTYPVTIKDANNCELTGVSVTITEPEALAISAELTQVKCKDGSNGAIDLTVTGGNGSYQYVWNNDATTQDLTNLTAGEYNVTVKDAKNCSISGTYTITEPELLQITSITPTNITCPSGNDGKIEVAVTGGTTPYSYQLNGGTAQSSAIFETLIAGNYTVTVTDANGCSTTSSTTLTQPDPLALTGCPTNITKNTDEGESYATVTWTEPTFSPIGNGATLSVTGDTATNQYSVGTTTITYTVTNACDESQSCSFTITVSDNQAPVITCAVNGNQDVLPNSAGNTYTHSGNSWNATATDNVAVTSLTYTLTDATVDNTPKTTLDGQVFNYGTTTVTWEATDNTGKKAQCSFQVVVADNTEPELACPTIDTVYECLAEVPEIYADYAAFKAAGGIATDNHQIDTLSLTVTETVVTGCPTTITRTYSIKDMTGNAGTCTQVITVEDKTAPALKSGSTLPAGESNMSLCFDSIPAGPTVADIKALYEDNCGGEVIVSKSGTPTGNDCGWSVTYTYDIKDTCENATTASVSYSGKAADFTMPEDGSSTVACASEIAAPTLPEVKDACGTVLETKTSSIVDSPSPLTCEGTRTYTYTYEDCAGHSHDWTYTYTIEREDFSVPADTGSTVACIDDATVPTAPSVTDNCGNALTPSTAVIGGTYNGCEGTRTYTFTYTDCAGHSHDWTYTYTIERNDFTMPENAGKTIACASQLAEPTLPEVKDACGNVLEPSEASPVISATPSCEGDVTYTYTYKDCEGNSHDWVYTYTIERNDFTMPANAGTTIACASQLAEPTLPEVKDACGNVLEPTATSPVISETPECEGDVTYTYTYKDCEGNSHDWVYTYTIEREDFTMPADGSKTVACASEIVAPTLPTVKDNCNNPLTGVLKSGYPTATPSCEGTVTYVYTFTDCEGNTHDWTYTYTIEREDFTIPANTGSTVACIADATEPTAPSVTDNCGNALTPSAAVEGGTYDDDGCEGTRTYTFTYTDCEGNTHDWTYTYTIEREDFDMPADGSSTVACASLAVEPELPTVTDDCDNALTGVLKEGYPTELTGCEGTVTYVYTFTDCEGNTHDWTYTYTIEREDFDMPADGSSTVACASLAVEPELPTVTDDCDNALTGVLKEGYPTELTGCEGTVTYVYTFTDCAGHSHDWTYIYTIEREDFDMPADGSSTVACASLAVEPELPTVTDDCDNALTGVLKEGYPTELTGCEGTVTYVYTFTDCEGNAHDWTYIYTIEREDFEMPEDDGTTVACPSLAVAPALPTVTDNCGDTLTGVLKEGYPTATPACEGTVTYVYTFTDCEGNTHDWTYTYTIEREDFDMPADGSSTVACASLAVEPELPTVTDDCDNALTGVLKEGYPTELTGCEGTVTYVYTFTDCEGNTHDWVYTYTIEREDFTIPANTGSTVACIADATEPTAPSVTDNCGNALTPSAAIEGGTYDGCEGTRTYTFTYTDCEGNTHDWTYTYTIEREDFTIPANTGSTVACIADATAPTAPSVTDNCGNALTPSAAVEGGTYDGCEGTRTYTFTYTDCEGNTHDWTYTYTIEREDFTMPSDTGSTVACIADATVPTAPSVTDNCGNALTPSAAVEGGTYDGCEGTRTYTFTYTDCEGNSHDWVYTYTIERNDFTMPADGSKTVACASEIVAPTLPTVKDNCNNPLTGVLKSGYPTATPACEGTVTYVYTFTDCAGHSHDWTYTYTITAPTLTFTGSINDVDDVDACYSDTHKSRLLTAEEVKAMYTSSCSREITVEISDNVESDNDCNWKITRTYNISDGGCNTDSTTMSVSGSDQTAPAIGTDDLDRTLTATNCVFRIPDLTAAVRNISTDCSEITVTQPSAGMVVYPMVAERDTTVNVIVTDSCGNSSVKEVVITIPAKVTISATATPATICYGATSQLTATPSNVVGTATYNWTPSDGLNNATIANPVATLTTTTTYTVEVTDENGCAATATTTVTVNPEVVMDAVDPMTLCVGDVTSYSFTTPLTVGTMSYAWTNSNTAIGLGANGDGDIPSFTPTNTTNAPINATITVTPSHTYNDTTCVGDPINFTITVRPSIKTPGNVEFACPADTTVVLSYSDCEQLVNIGEPEFENHMSGMNVNITNDAPEGNIFPEGTTIVTWTATDECGDTLTCTQNVVIQFPPCGDTIADFDGYRYSSVRIGCQCWTGENARSEHYSDGTPVDNFRYYNDSDSLENIYGKLYTWYTAVRVPEGDNNAEPSISTDPFGTTYVQGICPEGWALPTVNEYMQMIANSGDATHAKDGSNLYWLPGYEGQPPFSGFDAYGAGKYNGAIDRYQDLLGKTYFWTTLSGSGSETATTVEINYYCAEGLQTELSKGDGVSIRCIRKR